MDLKKPKTAKSRARKYKPGDVQYLNEEELAALFRSIDSPRDTALFEVAYHRGLRASEVGQRADDLFLAVQILRELHRNCCD